MRRNWGVINRHIPHSRPTINEEDICPVISVLRTGQLATGKEVQEFVGDVCRYVELDTGGGVATNSGTNALYLALKSLGIGTDYDVRFEPGAIGDEVIIPSYVCRSVLSAVEQAGAQPVLADIEPDSYNIDPADCYSKISENTKAIIVPHMFGTPANLDEFLELRSETGVPFIEDCAQAIGARYKGKKVGSSGDLSIFSFYATKCMTTGGHGGMVLTNSEEALEKLKRMMQYDKTQNHSESYNYSLTDPQAAMGRSQLRKLDGFNERRREIAKKYDDAFICAGLHDLPAEDSIYFRYVIDVEDTVHCIRQMKKHCIDCEKPVFKPLHQYLNCSNDDFSNTERAVNRAISIPIYPSMSDEEVGYVCDAINEVWRK